MSAARPLDPEPTRHMTREEYLEFEKTAKLRHEFHNGVVTAMSGGSYSHCVIKTELTAELVSLTRDGDCASFDSDMRVRVGDFREDRYVYPDASVACGDVRTDDGDYPLLTPTAVFEVTSPSTGEYDRSEKLKLYLKNESVRDVVLIASDSPAVQVISRDEPGDNIRFDMAEGLDASIEVPSLGIRLELAKIYRRARFVTPADETNSDTQSNPETNT